MATQKDLRFLYQSKNNATGLTDITAQIYVNDVSKAVAGAAIAHTANANGSKVQEVDSTNSPGLYEVLIKAADLTAWGVAEGSYSSLEAYVNSSSKSAPAIFREELTVSNTDDIDLRLGAPAGASVSADIAAVKSDTAAIKVDLESGSYSLQNILTAVQAIQNNAGFAIPVPSQLSIPSSGTNSYRVPLNIYNDVNHLIDPDSNAITVTLVNQAGTDRSSYLTGNSGGSAPAVKDSTGQYHIDINIPSTAVEEGLVFKFAYAIGGVSTARSSTTVLIDQVSEDGFALQSTLLATQTTVNSIQSDVTDATNGLPAIKTAVSAVGTQVTNLQTDVTNNVEGAGFSNTTDSLQAISSRIYFGGRCV